MKQENRTRGPGRHPHHGPEGRGGHHPRGRRPFDYGDLRLIVLGMIAERPRHGYEIMKAIEEQTGGAYVPSPGVIYPTLSWLEDMGYAHAIPEGGRKSLGITPEGEAFLAANQATRAEIATRMTSRPAVPEPILRSMDGLKHALRTRFQRGPMEDATVEAIASAITEATRFVETSMTETTERLTSTARVRTPKAAGYLAQLCKHFAHKIPASFEGNQGSISFPMGDCVLSADEEVLTLTVEAGDAEAVGKLEDVVARHLVRFAFREELAIAWERG